MGSVLTRTPADYKVHIKKLESLFTINITTTTLTFNFVFPNNLSEVRRLLDSAVYVPKVKKIILKLLETTGNKIKFSEKIKGENIKSEADIKNGLTG